MPRNFNLQSALDRFRHEAARDPRLLVRIVLGALLVANLIAAAVVFRPWEGSVEDMERSLNAERTELERRRSDLARLRTLVEKVGQARESGDSFLGEYFLDRQNAYSTVLAEVNKMADESGVQPRDHDFSWQPIEGSDTLSLLTINANYEGSYANLLRFVNAVDHADRFLIMDSLQAAPQEGQNTLRIRVRLYAFVREPGAAVTAQPPAPATGAAGAGL